MFDLVRINQFGFYELKKKPTQAQLEQYYANKYYQNAMGGYEISYTNEEIQYIKNKISQKYEIISKELPVKDRHSFLDIGCGEGWALQFFKDKSWDILGLDYSEYGCEKHNPACYNNLKVGDIYENIKNLISEVKKFDCIWLDNVLEHVLDPLKLLQDCKGLIENEGVLVIEVPNDFSTIQQYLYNHEYISKAFWVVEPDHISYFNKEGLISVCEEAGWNTTYIMGDFPIDLNLFNPDTNYISNSSVGKLCHQVRITVENLFHNISPQKTIELYKVLAEMGLGRQVIGFFK